MKRQFITFFFLLSALIIIGCAINPVSGKRDFVLMNESQEITLGRNYHPKIIKQFGRYNDPKLQEYVSYVGNRLAASSHRPGIVYRFTVLDSPDVNAFALPGGYIYIYRGLLSYLNSEAELAAVLGHELGHITARHGVRQQSAATAANLGYTIGQIFIPELRNNASQNIFGVLSGAMLSGYGREHELQADALGAEYLARAGYDPNAIITVLKVLRNQSEFSKEIAKTEGRKIQSYHGLFATHPDNDTRLQSVVSRGRTFLSKTKSAKDNSNFPQRLEGLTFGDSAAEGIRRKNRFYHKDLGFAIYFPEGWILKNNPDRLSALAPQGKAFAALTVQDINKRISPREFIVERLGFTKLKEGKEISPNNLTGYTALSKIKTTKGIRLGRLSVIYFKDKAFFLINAAKEIYMEKEINDKMLKTALSFHPLKKEEVALAESLKIHYFRAEKSITYKKLADKSRIPGYAESQLRLLNNQYPIGEPIPGKIIKIVR